MLVSAGKKGGKKNTYSQITNELQQREIVVILITRQCHSIKQCFILWQCYDFVQVCAFERDTIGRTSKKRIMQKKKQSRRRMYFLFWGEIICFGSIESEYVI